MNRTKELTDEIKKVVVGADTIIEKVMMAILAQGHILLEDVPGVGKTTLALAFSKALGLDYKRIQFTPDTLPSDVIGFSLYQKETDTFEYKEGAVITNLLLADEINRTSSKTQAALLEVMEEGQATVDGVTHKLPKPFVVISTQNPFGSAGTQMLPQSQLDRFMVKLSMGMPDTEGLVNILRDRLEADPMEQVKQKLNGKNLIEMQNELEKVYVSDDLLRYIALLAEKSQKHERLKLGISPRGALAVLKMAKACAYMEGRKYVLPEHVQKIFTDTCSHRVTLTAAAKAERARTETIMEELLKAVAIPGISGWEEHR